MNIQQLVSAVIKFALDQHEDSKWNTVVEGMRRDEIAQVIIEAGATRPRKAIKALSLHLDRLAAPELALAV